MELVGTHALLRGTHEVDSHQPFMKRNASSVEDRTDCNRELLAALFALPQALACLASGLRGDLVSAQATAVRANCPVRPTDLL